MTDQHEDPKFEQWLKDVARTTYHAPRTTHAVYCRIKATATLPTICRLSALTLSIVSSVV